MAWKFSRKHLLGVAVSTACLVLLVTNCKFRRSTLRNSMGDKEGLEYLVPGTLEFKRESGNRSVGILKFQTKIDTYYQVHYWVQGVNENNPLAAPCADKQLDTPCPGLTAQRDFQVRIEHLDLDKPYTLRLFVWPPTTTKKGAKSIKIEEQATQGGADPATVVDELIVSRTIMPLQASELYRHKLDAALPVSEIVKKFEQDTGCSFQSKAFQNPFARAEDDPKIKSISSDGFAVGSAKAHPHYANRLVQLYSSIEAKSIWQWAFEWEGAQKELSIQPASYLNKIFLVTESEKRLTNKRLIYPTEDVVTLPSSGTVKIRWEPANLAPTSYITVQLKAKSSDQTLTCVFPGDGEQESLGAGEFPEGTLDPELFKNLPADEYNLLVYLDSTQVYVKDPNDFPAWVISAQDWRHNKVQKP